MKKEEILNKLIEGCKTENISDGYHTFGDLYRHRYHLFIALCRAYRRHAYKAMRHNDGTCYEGYFLLGIFKVSGNQISYHLPMEYWDELDDIKGYDRSPVKFDDHKPNDILERLLKLR